MDEKLNEVIAEIESDITYFERINFNTLADKFRRDLTVIKSLVPKED